MTTRFPIQRELTRFLSQARPQPLRSMRQFAEEEIIIPDGPFQGRHFRCHRQPYTGLWFDAVDSGCWSRHVATGPTQSGKTLACFVIPIVYHLFEVGETVICGLPDMDMAADKWREDLLPVIEQSRYRELLPKRGGGSRGGRVETIQFRNGATLKYMSGGGGDKSRAGYTSRVVAVTETDGMDQPGGTSRESDKITQLEARTRAYGSRKRIYLECTVSTEEGRTWQEYKSGTQSSILLPCPHCRAWVAPEREHFVGWQGADSQAAARASGAFSCPECGEFWTAEQRIEANRQGKLIHRGQSIGADGQVTGAPPATDTLGFRWSAVNNLFLAPGDIAADEWRASRSADEENAEREMRQFVWCLPVGAQQVGGKRPGRARVDGPHVPAAARHRADGNATHHRGGRSGQIRVSLDRGGLVTRSAGPHRRLRPDRSGQRRSGRRAGDHGGAAGVSRSGPGGLAHRRDQWTNASRPNRCGWTQGT